MLSEEFRALAFGEAGNDDEAAGRLIRQPWDMVVLGLSILGKSGLRLLQDIRSRYPSTRVLVLGLQSDSKSFLRAQELGAAGFVCKNAGRGDLLKAFRAVLAGKKHFGNLPSQDSAAVTNIRHGGLSAREYGVMLGYVAGKRPGELAADLNLSVKTISTYKRRLLAKLGLDSTADLVRYAIEHHLN
jgi:two-component system invasion response regulator UvrY